MSADMLRDLYDQRATSVNELKVLLGGVAESTVYRYFGETELRFGQVVALCRHAEDDRVREAILKEILPGAGVAVTFLPEALDADGDGDVDTDDALAKAINAVGALHQTLNALRAQGGELDASALRAARDCFAGLLEEASAGAAVIDFLIRTEEQLRLSRRRCKTVIHGSGVRRG